MEKLISQLGSEPVYGPVFMAWSILLFIHGELTETHIGSGEGIESSKTVNKSRRFGNMAMQLGALDYLHELLESETFTGNSVSQTELSSLPGNHFQFQSKIPDISIKFHFSLTLKH